MILNLRSGARFSVLCLGVGLAWACTVADKGDYTFSDSQTGGTSTSGGEGGEATGGRAGTGLGGRGGSGVGGRSGAGDGGGEGGERTGGNGGQGGSAGSQSGGRSGSGGSSGQVGQAGEGGAGTPICMPNATRCTGDDRLATCNADGSEEIITDCPPDTNPCTDDICDPATDDCGHPTAESGTACSTTGVPDGVCVGTRCECGGAGQPCCEAPNECITDYVCNTADLCISVCDDGNPCTVDMVGTGGMCTHDPAPRTTSCRASTDDCDAEEFCDGATTNCPADELEQSGVPCRSAAGGCDVAEVCDGNSAVCPADRLADNSVVCRAAAGACDVEEKCTGSSSACPSNAYASSSTECRASAGACDRAENCTGNSANCPSNAYEPASTVCRSSAGTCDVAENCSGNSAGCPTDAFRNASTECRASAGQCDVAENCTGNSAGCPTDAFRNASTECRASAGQCDIAENCTGNSAGCPTDAFRNASTECRASAGQCDVAENCTGSSAGCPADVFRNASTECRAQNGVCDVAENCPGNSAACPGDGFASVVTVCRAAAGLCDAAETCPGTSGSCPGDALANAGTTCRPTTFAACDPAEVCTGSAKNCPPDTNTCGGSCFSSAVDVYQRGFGADPNKPQFTRCGSLSYGANGEVTCINPVVRYGNVPNGVPIEYSTSNHQMWCEELGCSGYVVGSVTTGTRACAAPSGGLFWCHPGYPGWPWDEPTAANWCDYSEGYWFNQTLDYHTCNPAITSITCQGTVHNDGWGHSWTDGNVSATYNAQTALSACRAWSVANDYDPALCQETGCSCYAYELCAYNSATGYDYTQRPVWFYGGAAAGTVTDNCCGCAPLANWR